MKIAVIGAREIPAKLGGIELYCQELYPQIVARGHEVDLYVQPSYHHQSWFSTFIYQKMKVIILPSLLGKQLDLLNLALNTICATFGKYDVIHIHGVVAGWFTWFPQLFSNSSIIITCHQLESNHTWKFKTFSWLLPWLEKIAVYYADQIIVTAEDLVGYFFSKYSVCPHYIANAPARYMKHQNSPRYRRALGLEQQRYLLYVGTFEPNQKIDLLIKVFQKLQPHNWKLVLAGDISHSLKYSSDLLSMAKQHQDIIFTGEIRGSFLAELVHGAHLFVNPAQENRLDSSVAMLEAMRSGIPVVASDIAHHRQIIGQNRGLLFKSGQFDSLLFQLQYAMFRPNLLLMMAKKAQTYIAINHNWDKVVYQNLFLYLQLTTKISLHSSHYRNLSEQHSER